MIFHKHKCIFIHIPKSAGSSITDFFVPDFDFKIGNPNYEILFGWCPKRKIYLQHATTKQLLETDLITKEQWKTYFKFTFVRNPWDRAYSDYLWMQKEINVKDSFNNFILKKGKFSQRLNNSDSLLYRGDHLIPQTDFFDYNGELKLDYIGRFENFNSDIMHILKSLDINKKFEIHINKSKSKHKHYSQFYSKSKKKLIEKIYTKDIEDLGYQYEDKKLGFQKLKNYF